MPTFSDDYAAIRALKSRLLTVFGVTYVADFVGYGGVDIQIKTDEDDEPENVGKPLILIEQESGDVSEWSSVRSEYRDVTVLATSYVSDNSGAVQGTANPTTSDELLSKRMVADVQSNYAVYNAVGIENIKITPQRLTRVSKEVARRIPHRIFFSYERTP